jgi:hypothetical protein
VLGLDETLHPPCPAAHLHLLRLQQAITIFLQSTHFILNYELELPAKSEFYNLPVAA